MSLRRRPRKLYLTVQSLSLSGTTDPSFRRRRFHASWGTESDVPQSGQMMMSIPVCRTATVSGLDRQTGQSPMRRLRSGSLFGSMTEGDANDAASSGVSWHEGLSQTFAHARPVSGMTSRTRLDRLGSTSYLDTRQCHANWIVSLRRLSAAVRLPT